MARAIHLDRPSVLGSGKTSWPRFLKFNLTTGVLSIAGNLLLMKMLAGLGHMNYLVANGITITACSVLNFLVSDTYVFAETTRNQSM